MSEWQPIETAPSGDWIMTFRKGERLPNICIARLWPDNTVEWCDLDGRTTVTHNSFAPPTHWMPLPEPPK